MIERVSPISRATAAVLPGIVGRLAPEAVVPVILLATKQEARGALMRVGGLRVIDRTFRQMARLRDVHVTVVSDGSIRMPRRLPSHVTVRTSENPGALVNELKAQMDDPIVIGADVVRVQQVGLRSDMVPYGRLLPRSESPIRHFHRLVHDALASDA